MPKSGRLFNRQLGLTGIILVGLILFFFIFFLIWPTGYVFYRALVKDGSLSLLFFSVLFRDPLILESVINSLLIAGLVTIFSVGLGTITAELLERWDFTGRRVFKILFLAPIVLPPFVGAVGIRQVLARYGPVNLLLMKLGFLDMRQPIDWLGSSGFFGIVILQTITLTPVVFLNVSAAMKRVDSVLYDAAFSFGSSRWRVFWTITLPLIMPGIFAGGSIAFIWSFTDLGTPLVFGFSSVVAVRIFDALMEINIEPAGYALVVIVLLLSMTFFLIARRFAGTIGYEMAGAGPVSAAKNIGRMRSLLLWVVFTPFFMFSLSPHISVIVNSLAGHWFFSVLPNEFTIEHYMALFSNELTTVSIRNSLFYAFCSAWVDLFLGVVIAWLVIRCRAIGSQILDILAMFPLALPGIVLAFGYVAAFNFNVSILNPRQNPVLLLIMSYAIRRLPYMIRSATAGFQQSSLLLEEASAMVGVGPIKSFFHITLPLMMPHLVAGYIMVFAFALLEVSDSLILAMRQPFFPITKAIWLLVGRIDSSATGEACALGVVGMFLLALCFVVLHELTKPEKARY